MKHAAHLEIHTWVGTSIGAEHYYGEIKFYGKDKKLQRHSVTHAMTAKEAKELNRKDRDVLHLSGRYKPGDETSRFSTEQEVVKSAIEWFKANHPAEFLIQSAWACCSAAPLLVWPDTFQHAEQVNALAKEWNIIGGYEGNEERADEIDEEFMTLMKGIL